MKKTILAILLALPLLLSAQQKKTLPVWQEGYLDIHNVATACGDCTFIKMPDGTTMLIDAGDMRGSSWNVRCLPDDSRTPAQWIARYISRVAPGTETLDYVFLTHLHPDHCGNGRALRDSDHGYKVCGITEVGEYFKIGKMVDRGYPTYDLPSKEYCLNLNKAFFPHYLKFLERVSSEGGTVERFKVGSRGQFALLHDPASYKGLYEVFNIAGNALKATVKGKAVKMYAPGDDVSKFDENMFSCAIRIRYGNFVYYNGGDLPGNNYGPKKRAAYNRDYESEIADLIGHANAVKADHHGWKDSCNPNFLWKVRPDVIVIQASQERHPWVETAQRFCDPQYPGEMQLYITSDRSRKQLGEELYSKFHTPGHIVFRVYPGGENWQVFVLDANDPQNWIIEESELKQL